MNNNKTTRGKVLTNIEKAYIAGFFDGEGCVSINKSKARTASKWRRKYPYSWEMQVFLYNNDKKVIDWIRSKFQTGYIRIQKRPEGKNWKANYALRFSSRKARFFLEEIKGYLKVKKERALLAIRFQKYKSSCKHRRRPGTRAYEMLPKDIEFYDSCHKKLMEMNQRLGRVYVPPAETKRREAEMLSNSPNL